MSTPESRTDDARRITVELRDELNRVLDDPLFRSKSIVLSPQGVLAAQAAMADAWARLTRVLQRAKGFSVSNNSASDG